MRRVMVLVMVAALALAGCGGDSGEDETIDAPGQSNTTAGGDHSAHGGGAANTSCTPAGTTLSITAQSVKFNTDCLAAPANQAFSINFDNKDTLPHNIQILESHSATTALFDAEVFQGPATRTFSNIGPLTAGTYAFHCKVHPNQMSGTLVVK